MSAALLTVVEAAERLGVQPSWLRRKVAARAVPFTRLGRYVRFSERQLDDIIAAAAQPTIAPRRGTP